MNASIILCTVPSNEVAEKIANSLVESKLAACVNIIKGLTSIYLWKGAICKDEELLLVIKTRESLFEQLKIEILKLHPYEVPEIIASPITHGHEAYLNWIDESTMNIQ